MGKGMTMTAASARRIGRLYQHWIGYDPIKECGEAPADVLELLREYRAERLAEGAW